MKARARNGQETPLLIFFLVLKISLSYLLVNRVYELHRDEYLHLDLGNHLAAGYTSVPPLTGIVSALIKLAGGGFFWVRLWPALFGAATIFFCWKTVRLLGGNLLACCFAALACLCSALLRINTLYQPNSFDILAWTAVFYYLLKYFKDDQPLRLYQVAVCAALGFLNKYNIVFLGMGLVPALMLSPQRRIFGTKHFYLAWLLALLLVLPNLIWQFEQGFPVLKHMRELASKQLVHINRADFLINQLLYFLNSIVFLVCGLLALLFYRDFRSHRWVILVYVFTMAIFVWFRAKDYYALGLYPVLLSFGAAFLGRKLQGRPLVTALLVTVTAGSLLLILPYLMPLWSPDQIMRNRQRFEDMGLLRWEDGKNHHLPQDFADMQGWRELAALADRAFEAVPDRKAVLVRSDNYGQAGAINYYSTHKDINCLSYNADYLYWFDLSKPIRHLILIRGADDSDPNLTAERLLFKRVRKLGSVRNRHAREYGTSVYLLEFAQEPINNRLRQEIKEEQHDH
ncbi:ArnT family glycosyltransferase [Pedobacter yulinensis]|uniref:ArnT family glycosyltransferase n=1 Tax=Pedobacter yulinensis TaxID=2126353 RepID=UPI00195505F4|nr:glycosyltransferase family 39 protein [Pedobacter yulinensis]